MAKKKKKAPTSFVSAPSAGATVSDFEEIASGILTPGVSTAAPAPVYRPMTTDFEQIAAGILTPSVAPVVTQTTQAPVVTPTSQTGPSTTTVTPKTGPTATLPTGPMPQVGGITAAQLEEILARINAQNQISAEQAARQAAEDRRRAGQSAYNLLLEQFNQFGMGALVQPLQNLITEGLSAAEMTLRLRETDAYKKRFAANQQRINRGLRALSEAEYVRLEDQYQNIMRNYGLPETYYKRGDLGRQEGFEKFIAGDVSAAELEDRIQTAQNRVINAAPEVARTLRSFYPNISNGDILAYALNPDQALTEIRRKVTAAEIGAGAAMAGLGTTAARAEELGRYGVTAEAARQGFRTIAEVAPRGSQLAEFYKQTPYTQATAEQEVFGLGGAAEAGRQRRKLTELEQAAFSGQTGITQGALARDRAGAF